MSSRSLNSRVELYDLEDHLRRQVEILEVEPFVNGMNFAHAGAEIGHDQAFLVQHVGIAAAARAPSLHF